MGITPQNADPDLLDVLCSYFASALSSTHSFSSRHGLQGYDKPVYGNLCKVSLDIGAARFPCAIVVGE